MVIDIDETGKIDSMLAINLETNQVLVVDFVFPLVMVCTCDCWAL